VRLSFGKVAEMQRRGVVHYHAIIRLDGTDPDHPDAVLPSPAGLTVDDPDSGSACPVPGSRTNRRRGQPEDRG
jgi:hypothetical protein